ncbi:hypothetical protein [Amycolatopsis sp. NPDC004378]
MYVLAQIAIQNGFRLLRIGQFEGAAEDFDTAAKAASLFAHGADEAGDAERAHRWQLVAQGRHRFADEARKAAAFEARIIAGATA